MAKAPILDLNTLIERPTIKVDGTLYELLSPHELSIMASQRFTAWGKEIERLAEGAGEEAQEKLDELIGKVCRAALVDMPDEVFAKLSVAHRQSIVQVFTSLLLGLKTGLAGAMIRGLVQHASLSTGEKSSRGSAGFSAQTPDTGSKEPPERL